MSREDYIPDNDMEFHVWQGHLITSIDTNVTTWGILVDDVTSLKGKQKDWISAFDKGSSMGSRGTADTLAKDNARAAYEKELRKFVLQWLAYNSKVSDVERERMGLTVRSDTRTPAPVPTSTPVGKIDFSTALQHSIRFSDKDSGKKAKPDGVYGCELWTKVGGDAPKTETECVFSAIITKNPHTITFDVDDKGKMVYYRMRWINTRGKSGPWGDTFSATVPG
jgi:hypothetical protein